MSVDNITEIELQAWNDLPGKIRLSPQLVTEWLFDTPVSLIGVVKGNAESSETPGLLPTLITAYMERNSSRRTSLAKGSRRTASGRG